MVQPTNLRDDNDLEPPPALADPDEPLISHMKRTVSTPARHNHARVGGVLNPFSPVLHYESDAKRISDQARAKQGNVLTNRA